MFDVVTVGHFTIDFIIPPGEFKPRKRLGGPPTYVSLSALKLGSSVSVISKVGEDFPARYVEWLKRKGVDLSGLKICEFSKTTSFLLKYYLDGRREMILRNKAPPIKIEDFPSQLKTKVIHIAPIANEVTADLIMEVSLIAPIITLDPQGLLRRFDSDGRVNLQKIDDLEFLRKLKIFKSSENEIKVLAGRENIVEALRKIRNYGVEVAIATMGERGALISFNNKIFSISAAKPRIVVDPTGAGDAFIGAFLAEYIKCRDPLWCACVGSAAASFLIEKVGPNGFRGRKYVYERAMEVYEKALTLN